MPLTPDWAAFFAAELAALAALTGFVVVAISINLSRILAYSWLPSRAGEALIGPVGAITATSLVLIPGQPAPLLGAEVVVAGLVMAIVPMVIQARSCLQKRCYRCRARDPRRDKRGLRAGVRHRRRLSFPWIGGRAFLDRRGRHCVLHRGRIQLLGADG